MATRADENFLSVAVPDSLAHTNPYFVHGASAAMCALQRTIADIASTDIPVLLVGESGTGKEVAALEIHRLSRRSHEPFVKCGCSGLTGDSLSARMQRSENISGAGAENNGSLFLDGINHLDPAAQGRLLNLLPDGSGTPPQGCHSMRVISSTTRNLEEEMKSGRFREELYYRINGVHLRLPPLRDRKEDIPALLEFFFKKYTSLFERPEPRVSESTMSLLLRHSWPGNIRELENAVARYVILGSEDAVCNELFEKRPAAISYEVGEDGSIPLKRIAKQAIREMEGSLILRVLQANHWNRRKTAEVLKISYRALLYKIRQAGLPPKRATRKPDVVPQGPIAPPPPAD
jgi:two-component system response regulator AtoC